MMEALSTLGKPVDRFRLLQKPTKEVGFDEWVAGISENFPELLEAAIIGASAYSQLLIKDISNPFACIFVDVPASGKTTTLNFFDSIDDLSYVSDKFTPASFVSNAANVKKDQLKDVDLLPRLDYRVLLIRDFSTVFSKREEDLTELLGLLTRVLDGEGLSTDSGVHGRRSYVGEHLFMILGASTPIPERVWKTMSTLGPRLLFFKPNSPSKTEEELIDQLVGDRTYKAKISACRQSTSNFILTLRQQHSNGCEWNRAGEDRNLIRHIGDSAKLLAGLRGKIEEQNENAANSQFESSVVIEKPDRLNQSLYNLARGLALLQGRNQINLSDIQYINRVCLDSAPSGRTKLFSAMLKNGGTLTTREVEQIMDCSKPTALRVMKQLRLLGLCNISNQSHGNPGSPETFISLNEEHAWFMSNEAGIVWTKQSMDTVAEPLNQIMIINEI